MKIIDTKIGDHYIQICSASETFIQILLKNFQIKSFTPQQDVDLKINIESGYGVSFLDYNVDITQKGGKIYFKRADYLIEVDSAYKNAAVYVHDQLALKHALTNLYSSFLVHHNWGLLIHSSCAIDKGKAHIFSGHSGAGKSTAAKLSYPRDLLSDEASLVKITPGGAEVYNSPFRSELEAGNFAGSVELASVQLLFQAQQNKRLRMTKSDALFYLMDKVFFWPHNQEETKKIMKLLTQLVKNVPVYELHFQKNNTFWELIS